MGKESQAKKARRAIPDRDRMKRAHKIQRIVNYDIGPSIMEEFQNAPMDKNMLSSVRGFVLRALRERNVDMTGLDVYPKPKGKLLTVIVGPKTFVIGTP